MAPTDSTQQPTLAAESARAMAVRRGLVYVVAALVVLVALWALIEGGERDLWTQPSTLDHPRITAASLL